MSTKTGSWSVSFDLTLNGEDVRWEDLDEATQEHIAEKIKEGYFSGEIVEESDEDCDEDSDDEEPKFYCEECGTDEPYTPLYKFYHQILCGDCLTSRLHLATTDEEPTCAVCGHDDEESEFRLYNGKYYCESHILFQFKCVTDEEDGIPCCDCCGTYLEEVWDEDAEEIICPCCGSTIDVVTATANNLSFLENKRNAKKDATDNEVSFCENETNYTKRRGRTYFDKITAMLDSQNSYVGDNHCCDCCCCCGMEGGKDNE